MANIKKVDCALLPPCKLTLKMHVLRANYVSMMWSRASSCYPTVGLNPVDYGWYIKDGLLHPLWFSGPSSPDITLFSEKSDTEDNDSNTDDEAWSENSENSTDDDSEDK